MVRGRFKRRSLATIPDDPPPEKLKTSKFDSLKDVEDFSRSFDEGLKRTFFGEKGQQYIKFRNARAYDSNHGIKGGKLVLPG